MVTSAERVARIQEALVAEGVDGWLLCDFHNRDLIAYRVLGLEEGKFTSRRWFYFVPATGSPIKLVHAIEQGKLDSLPGEKRVYLPWQQLQAELRRLMEGRPRVAMQYSPDNNIPYVDLADPGIVDLVRSFGHTVVSSANLVQTFEAVLSRAQFETHVQAGEKVQRIKDEAFHLIEKTLKQGGALTEHEVQQSIIRRFTEEGLNCDREWPIVAVNAHAADPHFEPTAANCFPIRKGDCVLIDLWARLNQPGAIYYDITWCGFAGKNPPEKYRHIFSLVMQARNAALDFVRSGFAQRRAVHGYEVDNACRQVIAAAGFGPQFIHRTGHSIGTAVHGNGVHMDGLETKDERQLVPGICFSIEPGIYLPGEIGARTEIDAFITLDAKVEVIGAIQDELLLLDV